MAHSGDAITSAGAGTLKKRSVVSSFIFRYEDGASRPLVALFKRSGRVRTYQYHLAPISGSIEKDDASPLAVAWRELHEETSLSPATLELMRQGKSFTFSDAAIGREWTIYPFAFKLKAADSHIQVDWEHEGWDWYDPFSVQDSEAFGGVPHLAESLRRVWFEWDLGIELGSAGAALASGLDLLKNDHRSGARQLATTALGVLRKVAVLLTIEESNTTSPSLAISSSPTTSSVPLSLSMPMRRWWDQIRLVSWHLWKNGRESMGSAILSVLLKVLKDIELVLLQYNRKPNTNPCSAEWRDTVVGLIEQHVSSRATSSAGPVAEALVKYLENEFLPPQLSSDPNAPDGTISILTLSESSTITQFLHQLVSRSRFACVDVRVLESRPLFEGVSLAASLVRYVQSGGEQPAGLDMGMPELAKTKITVYSDASAALAADGVDIVLLGADRIASTGSVSNKTGSLPAVLCAKRVALAKVIVLSEMEKVATPGHPHQHIVEANDPAQILRTWLSPVNTEHVREAAEYFNKAAIDATEARCKNTTASRTLPLDVQVQNVFFEWVPSDVIDVYMTEAGIKTVRDISRYSEALEEEEMRLFNDL